MFRLSRCMQTPYGEKPLRISFDEVGGYIEKYGIKICLSLFPPGAKYERMFERIKYLIQRKGDISDVY